VPKLTYSNLEFKKKLRGRVREGENGQGGKGLEREEWMREALPQTKIHHYTIGKDNCKFFSTYK